MSREDEGASANLLLVTADERAGSRFARATGRKGLAEHGDMDWLIEDISMTLKSWGHRGGPDSELIVKSDGEPSIINLREAFMRYHGGTVIPEIPATCEKN